MSILSRFKLSMRPEAIREKYDAERTKRLRSDGNVQYRELGDALGEHVDDPYVDAPIERGPITAEHEVVIVGGGFGGLLQGAHLRKQGIDDFVMVEKAGDFGGTWYWNRYPGAACDVESYIYLPLLDETGYVPTEKYVKAPEIHAYAQQLARTFDLYETALFQTQVTGTEWDEEAKRWIVSTDRGDRLAARYLIVAGGILHKAKLPGIKGIETFGGHAFHTSRWDYDYTGGGPLQLMDRLHDKKVGIIGTGATAIQAVPRLAEAAGELYVFQRTPSTVGPRGNRPTDPEWAASLKPGWQKERIDNFAQVASGRRPAVDMIDDGWTHIYLRDGSDRVENDEERPLASELADMERMEEIRARVDDVVKDKATAEALKPWYGHMCKRPCFHDEYLESFNRPGVTLVDTGGKGVQEVNEHGVVVDGREYPLDLLIYASGFEVTTEFTRRMGFDPIGPGGLKMSEAWAKAPATIHGVAVRDFPNLLVIGTTQGGGAGPNFVHMIHEAAIQIAYIVRWAVDQQATVIEPKKEATDAWLQTVFGTLMAKAAYNAACTPGYYNNEGVLDMSLAARAAYVGNVDDFVDLLAAWRDSGAIAQDFNVTRAI